MSKRVCPFWVGYLLLSPLRRFFENPSRMFGGLVREGMTVLEPGCGMGYFTIPLALRVGPSGKIIAIDLEPRMIAALEKRALKAGLLDRIELRLCESGRLGIEDLRDQVDFAAVIHMLHEAPDPGRFFEEIRQALKIDGRLLFLEPKWHVPRRDFTKNIALAQALGYAPDDRLFDLKARKVLLRKKNPDGTKAPSHER